MKLYQVYLNGVERDNDNYPVVENTTEIFFQKENVERYCAELTAKFKKHDPRAYARYDEIETQDNPPH